MIHADSVEMSARTNFSTGLRNFLLQFVLLYFLFVFEKDLARLIENNVNVDRDRFLMDYILKLKSVLNFEPKTEGGVAITASLSVIFENY